MVLGRILKFDWRPPTRTVNLLYFGRLFRTKKTKKNTNSHGSLAPSWVVLLGAFGNNSEFQGKNDTSGLSWSWRLCIFPKPAGFPWVGAMPRFRGLRHPAFSAESRRVQTGLKAFAIHMRRSLRWGEGKKM